MPKPPTRERWRYDQTCLTHPNFPLRICTLIDTGKVRAGCALALRDALKTNGNYAAAHWELGYGTVTDLLECYGRIGTAECERAQQLAPFVKGNGAVLNSYLYLGEYQKFLDSLPADDSSFSLFLPWLPDSFIGERQFDRAASDFDRAYQLDPNLYTGIGKALSDAIHQHTKEGLQLLSGLERTVKQRGVGDPEATYKIAQAYAVLADKSSALRALRMSVEGGFFSYPYIDKDPLLNDLQ